MSSAIEKKPQVSLAPLEFTPEQERMIRDSFLSGASPQEAAVLLELSKIRRLNPITRQIHFVKRWDNQKQREVWASQVGIDGFRAIGERTGLYDGQDEPEFEYGQKGELKMCRIRVYRKDWGRPAVGVAHFSEYVQTKKDGAPVSMWASKPHVMLSKCAEALAFRKAFPEDTSGLYAPEEMPDEREVNQAPPKPANQAAPKVEALKTKLAEHLSVVDAEVVTELKPMTGPSVWAAIKKAAARDGVSDGDVGAFLRDIRKKTSIKLLDASDLDAFCLWLNEEPSVPDFPPVIAAGPL